MSLETGAAHTSDSCNSTGQFLMIIVINDHSQSRNNATLMIVRAHQMAQKTMHGTAGVTGGVTLVQEATCTMTKAAPSCRV